MKAAFMWQFIAVVHIFMADSPEQVKSKRPTGMHAEHIR